MGEMMWLLPLILLRGSPSSLTTGVWVSSLGGLSLADVERVSMDLRFYSRPLPAVPFWFARIICLFFFSPSPQCLEPHY